MQKSTMESASWQRPLYGFEISQNQAKMPLKSGFSDGLGVGAFSIFWGKVLHVWEIFRNFAAEIKI
jgi:hypothetical protein